nr:transposase [Streptomyces virginiae]
MPERRPYPSDRSDARWELIEPVREAWRFERRGRALDFGRPPEHELRDIMDAILYVDRTGVQWRCLPPRLPALEHGLRLLHEVAAGGCVRPAQRLAQATPAGEGGTGRRAFRVPDRRTER